MCWKCSITDQHVYNLVIEGGKAKRKKFEETMPERLSKLGVSWKKPRRYDPYAASPEFPKL
jgi:hypothetical protein